MASASPLFPSSGISDRAAKVGFRFGAKGTHTSRTMMFDELAAVLAAAPETASREDYAAAIVEGNCLGKATTATRTPIPTPPAATATMPISAPIDA